MNNEFTREERYIVFKLSDVERYLTDADRSHLAMMKNEIDAGRDCANKPPFKGLIVESDWPEYESTWRAIEARVTGAQPAPIEQDTSVRKAWARFSNKLHHSHDAPYPGMSEAFEQHFSQSFTDREWRAESATWAAAWKAAKRHGAQPAPSVPDTHNDMVMGLDYQGAMSCARQRANQEAGLLYPEGDARKEEMERELAGEYYRQYTTPNQGAKP